MKKKKKSKKKVSKSKAINSSIVVKRDPLTHRVLHIPASKPTHS